MKEMWKDVVYKMGSEIIDFSGFYQVSNLGNVRSVDRIVKYADGRVYRYPGKKKATHIRHKDGYVYVMLSKNTTIYAAKVHRLVAMAFIPNPNNLPAIDHINTNRDDNRVENLRWVDASENAKNPISRAKRAAKNKEAMIKILQTRKEKRGKRAEHITLQCDLDGNVIREFKSLMEIYRQLGYDYSSIAKCCRGEKKIAYGYTWKYKDY